MLENARASVFGADHFRRQTDDGTAAATPDPTLVDSDFDRLDARSRPLVVWKFGGTPLAAPGLVRTPIEEILH